MLAFLSGRIPIAIVKASCKEKVFLFSLGTQELTLTYGLLTLHPKVDAVNLLAIRLNCVSLAC